MPSSRFLISSQTLGSAAASVTFSSIPATYTDLVLKISARAENAGANGLSIDLRFNGDTATNYSYVVVRGNSSVANSGAIGTQNYLRLQAAANSDLSTSNTFSNWETYIPSYTVSQNKPISSYWVQENNSSTAGESFIIAQAALWRNTAAITSIAIANLTESPAKNFLSGSSFYLYGLKNS
jgi:hypothetical protein